MIRRALSFLFAAVLVLASGCADGPTSTLVPTERAAELSTDIDLTGVLEFVALPDLTKSRHAEKYILASEGGTIEIHGFRVEIPAGALPADTLVTIDLPTDETLAEHVLAEFGPHGIQFNQPVKISFPLEGVALPGGAIEVRRWENDGWTSLGGAASEDGKSFSSTTPHFSTYVMAGG